MSDNGKYILIDSEALPDVFIKTLAVKELLEKDKRITVGEACEKEGMSRSAFYKYRDSVFAFNRMQGVLTLLAVVLDIKGVLSEMLNLLSEENCNILTINQGVPLNSVANITFTIQTEKMNCSVDRLLTRLKSVSGVRSINILSQQ